jgi:hypothetical protein
MPQREGKIMPNTPNAPAGQDTGVKDKAKSAASETAQSLKESARGAADTMSSEAANYANQARDTAASEVKGVASALRKASDELRTGSPQERTFSQIADTLADFADTVRDKDMGELVGSVNTFARRNPLAFIGGAALVGFAATRFAKASESRPRSGDTYGADYRDMDRPVPSDRRPLASTDIGGSPATTPTTTKSGGLNDY